MSVENTGPFLEMQLSRQEVAYQDRDIKRILYVFSGNSGRTKRFLTPWTHEPQNSKKQRTIQIPYRRPAVPGEISPLWTKQTVMQAGFRQKQKVP